MTPRPVRVAVVGAGTMGQHHLRIYGGLKGVDLVAVVDSDADVARASADRYGCHASTDVEDLVGRVDACSIATPSSLHAEIGAFILRQGIHCLVEKPLALTEADCAKLIDSATSGGTQLLVGHVERFNPAVQQMFALLEGAEIYAVDVRRMSAASARVQDVDVVADLMVHDLDIVRALLGVPAKITAEAVGVAGAPDYATALLTFSDGPLATLTASRITQSKIRELHVTSDRGLITVDYSTQQVCIYQQGRVAEMQPRRGPGDYVLDVAMERVFVRNAEPLRVELEHFIRVATGAETPAVTGSDALDTMRLVWEIQEAVKR